MKAAIIAVVLAVLLGSWVGYGLVSAFERINQQVTQAIGQAGR